MSRRRHNSAQLSLFDGIPMPPRGRGHRERLKRQWNETGRGDAEEQAELVRGVMIERLDGKLTEFTDYCVDTYGFSTDEAVNLFQWVQVSLFPEAFDVDLDTEQRKQGVLPRRGGDKLTARQIEAFHALLKEQKGTR